MTRVWKHAVGSFFAVSTLVQCGGSHGPREGKLDHPAARMAAETETLRKAYAAINRNDIAAAVEAFDPQIEWSEPAGYPGAGTYRGRAAVKAHLLQSRAQWAEGRCEPERLIAADDKIVVFVHVRVRLKEEAGWREARLADVYTFRNGKAIQMRAFADRRQALEWAGAGASEVS